VGASGRARNEDQDMPPRQITRMPPAVLLAFAVALTAPALDARDTGPAPRQSEALPPLQRVPPPAPHTAPRTEPVTGPVTGFPLPRYVSLNAGEANARRGPSRKYRIDWVFRHRNMPMMVVAEHGHWRRVVDRDGAGGWMHYALLSGMRTAIVEVDMLELRQHPGSDAPVRAHAELGVVGRLTECDGTWCRMASGGHWGWVPAGALWGVEPGEVFD